MGESTKRGDKSTNPNSSPRVHAVQHTQEMSSTIIYISMSDKLQPLAKRSKSTVPLMPSM